MTAAGCPHVAAQPRTAPPLPCSTLHLTTSLPRAAPCLPCQAHRPPDPRAARPRGAPAPGPDLLAQPARLCRGARGWVGGGEGRGSVMEAAPQSCTSGVANRLWFFAPLGAAPGPATDAARAHQTAAHWCRAVPPHALQSPARGPPCITSPNRLNSSRRSSRSGSSSRRGTPWQAWALGRRHTCPPRPVQRQARCRRCGRAGRGPGLAPPPQPAAAAAAG